MEGVEVKIRYMAYAVSDKFGNQCYGVVNEEEDIVKLRDLCDVNGNILQFENGFEDELTYLSDYCDRWGLTLQTQWETVYLPAYDFGEE